MASIEHQIAVADFARRLSSLISAGVQLGVALRAVEAVRMHAATHDGALPASLDEVAIVPVPSDLVTGGPFGYELTAVGARLWAPPTSDLQPQTAIRYELTIRKEEKP